MINTLEGLRELNMTELCIFVIVFAAAIGFGIGFLFGIITADVTIMDGLNAWRYLYYECIDDMNEHYYGMGLNITIFNTLPG